MQTSRNIIREIRRGFTLIELLIVVGVIVLLIGILVPVLGNVQDHARKAQTMATLSGLQTGLQSYFTDFNMYPPSAGSGNCSVMLAQGLMGFMGYDVDGAGPTNSDGSASPYTTDPAFGFRIRKSTNTSMGGGTIYGPYAAPDPKSFKTIPGNVSYFFADGWTESSGTGKSATWNHQILYFRSTRSPGAIPGSSAAAPNYIFETAGKDHYFDTADCGAEKDAAGKVILFPADDVASAPPPSFYMQLGVNNKASFSHVMGSDSYLLISAGPDGKFFTSDDIVVSKQ